MAVFDTGGHFTDTVAVDGNGDWGLTRSLVGGANVVYAIAENAYGTGPASNQVRINLVPTPPLYSPTIVLPATAYNGQIVTFSAPARNNKPQEGAPTAAVTATLHTNVFNLSLVSGGTAITGTWETTWTVSGLNNGDYRVRFTGIDQDGIEGYGETTLRVKGIPQPPEFTYPTGAITRSISTINVRGYAQAFTRLRLYADGALLTTTELGSTGMWQVPVTLSDGTHVITATASDQWEQVSPPGTAGLITVDTVSPTVTIQELAPYQNQITVTLRWDGNDPPPGTGVLNYDLKHQFGSAGSWLTLQYGTPLTEWVYTAGQEGTYNFRVLACDRAFNGSAWTETGTMVDLTEPGLSLALSSAPPFGHATTGTVYYGQGSGVFTLTAVATDTLSGLFSLAFPETTAAGATYGLGGATTATRSHPYAFDTSDTLSATLTVTATDRAGNQTTQPFRVMEDTTAPTVTIRVPLVAPLHFWVSWSGQDEESGLRDYDVQYKVGTGGTWTSWLTNTSQTQAPFVGEAGESYFFQVKATDNVNNTSAWVEAGPVTVSAVTKYYYHGTQRAAMRQGDVVYFIHTDHVGSTSLTTDITGTVVAETRYLPYGQERWITGTLVTDFTFTGQRAERGFGLLDYNARYYDPWLGRFVNADTLVPDYANPQALNRYSYVLGNPLRFTDPSGHQCEEGDMPCWEARWYEAHGYSQMDGKWTFTGSYEFWNIGALHEFVRDAQQDNPSVAQWQTDVSAMLSATATSLDYLNFALSAAGVGVEALATAGVEFADPTVGGGTLAGFAGGAKLYNLALNPIENRLSGLAALFVAASDLAAENTYLE